MDDENPRESGVFYDREEHEKVWGRPPDLILRTQHHPEANGRLPVFGDTVYNFRMVLEDGRLLEIQCGAVDADGLRRMFFQETVDDQIDEILKASPGNFE